jgi:ATP-dependent Clp protease protease subunit
VNKWYEIKNQASEYSDVYIFNDIGTFGITAQKFVDDIKNLDGRDIALHINSVGGEVFEGMAMHSIIKNRKGKTVAYIEGIAASIATVIALAADEVVMTENSLFMIHNAWGSSQGDAKEMMKQARVLEKISNEIAEIYVKKTGKSYDMIMDLMSNETWMTAEEAFEYGFIDRISDAIKVAAKADVSIYKNMTNEKVNKILNSNIKNSKMTEDLKNWFNSKIDEIVTKVKGDNNSETAVSDVEITIADKEEVMNKLTDFEAKLSEANETISNLTEEAASLNGEKATLTEEVERLTILLNKTEATGTEIKKDSEPAVIEDKVVDANTEFYNGLAEMIKNKLKH